MTKDKILAMEAGRELDALVAKSLGYQVFERYGNLYVATDEAAFEQGMEYGLFFEDFTHPDTMRLCQHLECYSANIAAAWRAMAQICDERALYFRLHRTLDYIWVAFDQWSGLWNQPRLTIEAQALTAPLAISRALLLLEAE